MAGERKRNIYLGQKEERTKLKDGYLRHKEESSQPEKATGGSRWKKTGVRYCHQKKKGSQEKNT